MKKTVTINLSGLLFHIDEDAYQKLSLYLKAVKQSLGNEVGKEEIIADIESRIAEIFTESKKFKDQVISLKEIDHMVEIMGQPKDFYVDEEMFEENFQANAETATPIKKLFKDPNDVQLDGVCSGFGHYFGIDPTWIRLMWLILTIISGGVFIIIYIAFAIFIPKAETTADQLAMKGEPVNISNISKKVKEEINSEDFKNKTSKNFETLKNTLKKSLHLSSKILNIVLISIAALGLFVLLMLYMGISIGGMANQYWLSHFNAYIFGITLFPSSVIIFLSLGIPLLFVLLLGIKMWFKNTSRFGKVTHFSLFTLWVICLLFIAYFGVLQYNNRAFNGKFVENKVLQKSDTLKLMAFENQKHFNTLNNFDFSVNTNEKGQKILVFDNTKLYVKTTTKDYPVLRIVKKSQGSSFENAKLRSQEISFEYKIENNNIYIDPYFITNYAQKYTAQEVTIYVLIPENSTLYIDEKLSRITRNKRKLLPIKGKEGNYIRLVNNKIKCYNCSNTKEDWEDDAWDNEEEVYEKNSINITDHDEKFKLEIDENGINIQSKSASKNKDHFNMKIDKNGVKMNTY